MIIFIMYIFVEAVTGYKIRLKVDQENTIQDVKYKIMICEGLPLDEQYLIYQEKNLENHRSLKYYQIVNDTTIRLIMKIKGGPVAADIEYEELVSESSPNNYIDKLTIIYLENDDLRFPPIWGLDMQSKLLNQAKDDLNDPSIFTYDEPINDQKMAILKLKMDCLRLGKKLSTLSRQQESSKQLQINNQNNHNIINKSTNPILHRSVSLYSRSKDYISDMSNNKNKLKNQSPHHLSRLPPLRTLSVVDNIKGNRNFISTFPSSTQNKTKNLTKSDKYFTNSKDSPLMENKNSYESKQRLPPLNESEYENKVDNSKRPRCFVCSKRMSLVNEFVCRCGGHYCSKHKFPEEHKCKYDFKNHGKLELIKSNPLVEPKKITKL